MHIKATCININIINSADKCRWSSSPAPAASASTASGLNSLTYRPRWSLLICFGCARTFSSQFPWRYACACVCSCVRVYMRWRQSLVCLCIYMCLCLYLHVFVRKCALISHIYNILSYQMSLAVDSNISVGRLSELESTLARVVLRFVLFVLNEAERQVFFNMILFFVCSSFLLLFIRHFLLHYIYLLFYKY